MIHFRSLEDVQIFERASNITENWITCFTHKIGNLSGASSLDAVTNLSADCVATYFEMLPSSYRASLENHLPSNTMRDLYDWHIASHSGNMSEIMNLFNLIYRLRSEIDKELSDLD